MRKAAPTGLLRIVLMGSRSAEHAHNGIADELLDRASECQADVVTKHSRFLAV
jgi:hypothetical protein